MKYIIILMLLINSLFALEDLKQCVQTPVSKTSVIFTCMHGEYYIEYETTSKRTVKGMKVLYTESEKYKYLKNLKHLQNELN